MNKGEKGEQASPDEGGDKDAAKNGVPEILGYIIATIIFVLTISLTRAFISHNIIVVSAMVILVTGTVYMIFRVIFNSKD